jgi:hypothetical protein
VIFWYSCVGRELVYEHLRNSPVYQDALRAPSAFAIHPVTYLSRVPKRQWPDYRVQQAGIRLDHLMCHALDPRYSYISRDHVSAMMTFLECFDRDLPRWNLSATTRAIVEPRIAFCRQIIEQRQEDCAVRGNEPPSSALFRETVIRNDGNIDEVVYDNPCYHYYSMSFFRPPLYSKLDYYWGDPI